MKLSIKCSFVCSLYIKLYALVQYNKFIKAVDRADQYLSFYSVLRKTVKWSKKLVLYLLNCALFSAFFAYRTLNTKKKVMYKNFPHEVGRSWISEVQSRNESNSDDLQLSEKKQHQGDLNRTRQADCPVISEYTNLKKLLLVGREKRSILQDTVQWVLHIRSILQDTVQCVLHIRSILQDTVQCVLHIRSEVKLDTFVNSALFRFTKGLVLRNTIQRRITRLFTCSMCSLEVRSIIYSVKL